LKTLRPYQNPRIKKHLASGQDVLIGSCPDILIGEIVFRFGHVEGFVLDVGCGAGDPTRILEGLCKHIVGFDVLRAFDKSNVSPNLDFCLGDAIRLPFRDECFDAVVSFDVIEHVKDDLSFLLEIRRVMKEGAKLLLGTPNGGRLSNRMKGLVKPVEYPLVLGEGCVHLREYSKNSLGHLLKAAGFKSVRIKGVWLGLRASLEVGISKFPRYLEKYSQYWLVEAVL